MTKKIEKAANVKYNNKIEKKEERNLADQLQEIPYKREKGSVLQMGAVLEKDSVNFALEIKEDEKASLLIYKKGQKEPEAEIPQEEAEQIGNIVAWRLKKFPYKRLEYN